MKKLIYSTSTLALVAGLAFQFTSVRALAIGAQGTAKAVVNSALAIVNVSDLDFGAGLVGDAAKTVVPGSSENAENGSFTVSGQAGFAYTITLPSSPVTLTTGAGGANETIDVTAFTSFPSAVSSGSGLLDGSGNQTLLIGATRAALPGTQAAGAYTGVYTVTVVY